MISQPTGVVAPNLNSRLFNLPGELRNNIYEYLLHTVHITTSRDEDGDKVIHKVSEDDDTELSLDLSVAVAVISTCRQLRTKYMPFFFRQESIPTWFYQLDSFLKAFFPTDGPTPREFIHKPDCAIEVAVDCMAPEFDILQLAAVVLENPSFTIFFHAQLEYLEWEAGDLNTMVKAIRANAAVWEARREVIESFSLKSREHDDYYGRPVWKM